MVAFSIFASVTITRAGTFTSLAAGLDFVARLLKGFMIGFAIATGVSLLILPITSRGDMFHDLKGYAASVEALLQAQISFVEDSSETHLFKGSGLLRRARTYKSTRDVQEDDDRKPKRRSCRGQWPNSMACTTNCTPIYSIPRVRLHGGSCPRKTSVPSHISFEVFFFPCLECRCCRRSWSQ